MPTWLVLKLCWYVSDCHSWVWGYHSKLQLGKINCYFHNIGQCHINFSSSNQSNFTACISQVWPSLSSTSQQFGTEILHKVCLNFSLCKPFCHGTIDYPEGHVYFELLLFDVSWYWFLLRIYVCCRPIGGKTFLLSSIIQITTKVFLPT
jgi:hypothetical protein